MNNEKLIEKIPLFLYAVSKYQKTINYKTFQRYIYLYYTAESFLYSENKTKDNFCLSIQKIDNGLSYEIVDFSNTIIRLQNISYVLFSEKNLLITINKKLQNDISSKLENNGYLYDEYKKIEKFISLIQSYNEDYIFTLFFADPTIKAVDNRNLSEFNTNKVNELKKILKKFKDGLGKKKNITSYDIFISWIEYILNYFYLNDSGNKKNERYL
ncbi:hypothetical protein [Treponema sp. OMZ 857]|uniref:hypothetical protein n=1 Tax=Treponema sp. OMZ 857 TaxID=1643513 RepID=UPI0020A563C1|nr:hypothetical protein [Treponema sp. OMZ 857]UTC43565.1 hypothetical protein E4N66_05450 [Treponema sp. OMZ 857]